LTTVLLDSHVLHWWASEPERLSPAAASALDNADELAVASITWFELAWLARRDRIVVGVPIRTWLDGLSGSVRTIGTTPAIADAAVSLPQTFPGDPADRIIFATAIEHGLKLISKDRRLRSHRAPSKITIW
jgi:PIN domain nuclease of toxin-antitoxin system